MTADAVRALLQGTDAHQWISPGGAAFSGLVISRLPGPEDAVQLWDYVAALAAFPSFAELKQSLRERPSCAASASQPGTPGVQEDWHAGSRRSAP